MACVSFLFRSSGERRICLVGVSLGAALCSFWMGGTALDLPRPLLDSVEMAGEFLVLLSLALAHVLAARKAGTAAWVGWLLWGALTCGAIWAFLGAQTAGLHVFRHLFHVGQAGIPAPLLGILTALALASLARMFTLGPRARQVALVLFLILACARGPGGELVALRLCAAVLLLGLSLPRLQQEEQSFTFAPRQG